MNIGPTTEKQRFIILDALRGLALLGIVLANLPEFALWTFLSPDEQAAMPTADIDETVRFWQFMLVDGKFYTIFSLLFGIGFAIIIGRHGKLLLLRRMLILAVIGLLHLLFLWSGDILLLYATGGLLLIMIVPRQQPTPAPSSREEGGWNSADRGLMVLAVLLIVLPVGLDALTEFCGVDFAGPFYEAWWRSAEEHGISEANFATWLRDADSYGAVFDFLVQGAHERMWEFVSSHRLLKVLGLFIMGYLIGRHRLYAKLPQLPMKPLFFASLAVGLPTSGLYAWSATNGHPWGLTVHSLLYTLSVTTLALAYVSGLCLLYLRRPQARPLVWLAAPGRMALSCYIGQTLAGIILFYGIGFGLGTSFGLVWTELTAVAIFLVQIACCSLWLHYYRFGPIEWLWRMLTYGRHFTLRKKKEE